MIGNDSLGTQLRTRLPLRSFAGFAIKSFWERASLCKIDALLRVPSRPSWFILPFHLWTSSL